MAEANEYSVKDSRDFIKVIEGIGIAEDEELVSFDVTALYTSLPINRTLSVVVELLEDEETPCVTTSLSSEQLVGLWLAIACLALTYRQEFDPCLWYLVAMVAAQQRGDHW